MILRPDQSMRTICVLVALSLFAFWFAYLRYHETGWQYTLTNPLRNISTPAHLEYAELYKLPDNTSGIAKVTVATNTLADEITQRALRTHQRHNSLHGYHHFIATNEVVSDWTEDDPQGRPRGAWSKPAYLLSIIVAELQKPESKRLKWVFWFDADTIIMNPYTPLEVFLPPETNKELASVNMVIASNWDGLNSGVFALRVDPWSVSFLSAVLAYPIYHKSRLQTERFRDQSAIAYLLQVPSSPLSETKGGGKDNWSNVPMRWFNSIPFNNAYAKNGDWIFNHNMTDDLFDKGTTEVYNDGNPPVVQYWKVMQGDLVVHFAGSHGVRDSWMGRWLDRAEAMLPEWANPSTQRELKVECAKHWEDVARSIASHGQRQRNEMKSVLLAGGLLA